jgi:hypothetical protein
MGKVRKDSRHIRYNWRISPESSEDLQKVRHYLDVIDDKFREEKIKRVLDRVQEKTIINFNFEKIQSLQGKVSGTDLRYLCEVYDSTCSPKIVLSVIKDVFGDNYVKDADLYDRVKKGDSLEAYLERFHSK